MDSTARLDVDLDLISDLLEALSDSASESDGSHFDADSSESGSEEDSSNSRPESRYERRNNFEDDRRDRFKDDKRNELADETSPGTDSESTDAHEDEEDNILNFDLDKLESRLTRLIFQATDNLNKTLEAETQGLPIEKLQPENRSELESCLVSFYSKLREQATSCLYTFYGPKSYEFARLLRLAISREERKAQSSFNKLWIKWCARRLPPVHLEPLSGPSWYARGSQPLLQAQERGNNASSNYPPHQLPISSHQQSINLKPETKEALEINKDIGAGDEKRVWNHITISRDQTRASDFNKELLNIFRVSNRNESGDKSNTNHKPNDPIPRAPIPHPPIPEAPSDESSMYSGSSYMSVSSHRIVNPLSTALQAKEMLAGGGAISPSPGDYSENVKPAIVPRDVENVLDRKFAARMNDQPQLKTSGEILRPETSGSNIERSVSEPKPMADGYLNQLMGRLSFLETENRGLKEAKQSLARPETVYFIQTDRAGPVPYLAFLDEPSWAVGPGGKSVLKSHFGIHDINGFLRQKTDVAFVINKYYDLGHQDQEVRAAIRDKRTLPRAVCSRETVRLQSFEMVQAMDEFISQQPRFAEEFPGVNISNDFRAPYPFWYCYRSKNVLKGLSPTSLVAMKLLTSWIEQNYGELYDLVENHLARGVVSARTREFLVKPGDVVVWREKRDLTAVVAESWPLLTSFPQARRGLSLDARREESGIKNPDEEAIPVWKSTIRSWQYGFDGSFYRRERVLEISFEAENQEEEVPITKLSAYPLQYAPETWRTTLDARGKMFWSCRRQRIAAYEDDQGFYGNSERFMIDFHTYEQLHSDSNSFKKSYPTIDDPKIKHMSPEVVAFDSPPPIPDLYVFPNTIPAYNLRSKKWVDLEVDQMRDVTWNKKSFEHLVVDIETKDLIQALITNQIARGQGTDTIDGKGNGLIILLHGGPGTGKTFTAESVAEMAEKPLFRVTCGDIGTKPEEVEKYLESVLHLGKNWGCVVLLDEADVFLEQRTLTDLERNALVSVFLRVLEYYEGILILTSNRVGTFDEAFKSRIQLSLHYENLTEGQRGRVWKNFLSRLKDLERQNAACAARGEGLLPDGGSHSMGIDFDDVECYLSDLARVEMNGRQIRNAITTARQLAKFKGELMAYHHLRHVIKVSSKFDSYLKNVQEGFSDDQIARGGGIR